MKVKKMILSIVGLVVAAPIFYLFYIATVENYQFKKNEALLVKRPDIHESKVAVVSFSRSGTTRLMANRIAQIYNADEYRIEAPEYDRGVIGLVKATAQARNHDAEIHPEKIDLSKYHAVFLGSPIWLYSPAPPIWAFLKNNNFDGKKVVLFNSHNSKFEQRFIDEFKEIAISKGATSFEHKIILRGRVGSQLTTDEFLKKVNELFQKR